MQKELAVHIGPTEWIVILIIIVLIFGPTKIPSLARSVGKAMTEFRKGVREAGSDINDSIKDPSEGSKSPDESNKT